MVRDLLTGKTSLQISHLTSDLLFPTKQIRLVGDDVWSSHSQQVQLDFVPFMCMHKGIQLWEVQY